MADEKDDVITGDNEATTATRATDTTIVTDSEETPTVADSVDAISAADATDTDGSTTSKAASAPATRRQVSVSLKSLLVSLGIVALLAVAVVFIVRDTSARSDLDDLRADANDRATAERIASDYARGAATIDYKDLNPWIARLKKGVSQDLQKQYDAIGQVFQQVMEPLRLEMTSDPGFAKTTRVVGDKYEVQAAVNISVTTAQAPAGNNATSVYTLVMDKGKNWQIDSVGDPSHVISKNLGPADGSATPPGLGNLPLPSPSPSAPQQTPAPAGGQPTVPPANNGQPAPPAGG